MKKLKECWPELIGVCLVVSLFGFIYLNQETDPAFRQYRTTWNGGPAIGQLHRDGSYSFYLSHSGNHIATMPAAEAVHFH